MTAPDASPGAPDADASRFRAYTLEQARADAIASGAGISTGFARLDECGLRFRAGKLYAIVGRPGEGKTSLLLEVLMRHVATRAAAEPEQHDLQGATSGKAPAVFISYEENLHHIYLRLLLRQVGEMRAGGRNPSILPRGLAEEWLRTGTIQDHRDAADFSRLLAHAAATIDGYMRRRLLTLVDGDADGGEIDRVLGRLTEGAAQEGAPPSLVIVDYYQKIRPSSGLRGASRQEQLQDVADRLRRYAKGEPGGAGAADPHQAVPVLVGAQVNRESASANGVSTQPELHHIREADDLANDAAGVMTLHRPNDAEGGELRVKLVKNRDGKRGHTVSLGFYGASGTITDTPTVFAAREGVLE